MDARDERRARNEARFREVNERVEELAEEIFDADDSREPEVWDFVCECHRTDCTERLPMTITEHEGVRRNGRAFVVVPGHADPALERVVEEGTRYWVVEKLGEAGELADESDPRA